MGLLQLAARMREEGRTGSLVTLLCDSGERYLESYYNPQWVAANIGDIAPAGGARPAGRQNIKKPDKMLSGLLEGSLFGE